MANEMTDWSFGQAIGWAAGGAIGCGVAAATLNFVSPVGEFEFLRFVTSIAAMYGAIGGVIGGVLGYALAHFFPAAWSEWRMSTSFLLGLFLSMLIFAVITFPSAGQKMDLLVQQRMMLVAAFVASFVAAGLGGVLNMFRAIRTS